MGGLGGWEGRSVGPFPLLFVCETKPTIQVFLYPVVVMMEEKQDSAALEEV